MEVHELVHLHGELTSKCPLFTDEKYPQKAKEVVLQNLDDEIKSTLSEPIQDMDKGIDNRAKEDNIR